MKKSLTLFAVFSLLAIIGCNENQFTEPVLSEGLNKNEGSSGTTSQGTIPLEGLLQVQGTNNTYYIDGSIDYVHELYFVDPIPPAPQYYIDLELTINASLTSTDFPQQYELAISGSSHDVFYVSEEGIYLLEKTFTVNGANNGLSLVCRFLVTTNGIGLTSMWLTVPNNIRHN